MSYPTPMLPGTGAMTPQEQAHFRAMWSLSNPPSQWMPAQQVASPASQGLFGTGQYAPAPSLFGPGRRKRSQSTKRSKRSNRFNRTRRSKQTRKTNRK